LAAASFAKAFGGQLAVDEYNEPVSDPFEFFLPDGQEKANTN
jgi:hypothetical protein